MKRLAFFLIILTACFFPQRVSAAAQIYTPDASDYNIRFIGPADSTLASIDSLTVTDIDNNGTPDIIVADGTTDYNSRTGSGSLYVIKHELYAELQGMGNDIDLSDSSTYSYRFDGANTGDSLGIAAIEVKDINNNGLLDIIVGSNSSDNNLRANSGSLYVIFDSVFASDSGTGNVYDLADSSNYTVRFDGDVAGSLLSGSSLTIGDINDDNKNDIAVGAYFAANNSRTGSGSVYVLYNDLLNSFTGTGNTADLATSTNYNLRFDGAAANNLLGRSDALIGDLDNDGLPDLVLNAMEADFNSRSNSGSVYILKHALFSSYTGTGNTIDMATSTNYTLRIDGNNVSINLGGLGQTLADYDQDGNLDLVLSASLANFNSRSTSGSIYFVNNDMISTFTGTGNTFLLNTTRFHVRFDGAVAGDSLGHAVKMRDMNNDGGLDLLTNAGNGDTNGITNNGGMYLIFNEHFDTLTGTGNLVDLANTNNYDIRYDGSTNNHYMGASFDTADIDGDGALDLIVSEPEHSLVWPNGNGFLYVIKYFPHTITHTATVGDIRSPFVFKGTVSAPNNPTHITRVQWGHERSFGDLDATVTSDFHNAWIDCNADDGAFDSNNEPFSCNHSALDGREHFTIPHTVFLRAQDEKGVWTPIENYFEHTFSLDTTPPTPGDGGSSEIFQIPQLSIPGGGSGIFLPIKDSDTKGQTVFTIIEPYTFNFDAFFFARAVSAEELVLLNTANKKTTNAKLSGDRLSVRIGSCTVWQVGNIQSVWYKAYPPVGTEKDAAVIIPELQLKPSILGMGYTSVDLIPAGAPKNPFLYNQLYVVHSVDGANWTLLDKSVSNPAEKTVAAITKVGGYYMIGSSPQTCSQVKRPFDELHTTHNYK